MSSFYFTLRFVLRNINSFNCLSFSLKKLIIFYCVFCVCIVTMIIDSQLIIATESIIILRENKKSV